MKRSVTREMWIQSIFIKGELHSTSKMASDRIVLNLSGKRFETTRHTLCSARASDDSIFALIAGGDFSPDESGCYFLDRPWKPFSYILTALQIGKLVMPEDKGLHALVEHEICYYGLSDTPLFGGDAPSGHFVDSTIVLEPDEAYNHYRALAQLPPVHITEAWNLVYRASRDGWQLMPYMSSGAAADRGASKPSMCEKIPSGSIIVMLRTANCRMGLFVRGKLQRPKFVGMFMLDPTSCIIPMIERYAPEPQTMFMFSYRMQQFTGTLSYGTGISENVEIPWERYMAHGSCRYDLIIRNNANTVPLEGNTRPVWFNAPDGVTLPIGQTLIELEVFVLQ